MQSHREDLIKTQRSISRLPNRYEKEQFIFEGWGVSSAQDEDEAFNLCSPKWKCKYLNSGTITISSALDVKLTEYKQRSNNDPQSKHSVLGNHLLKSTSELAKNKLKPSTASPGLSTSKCASVGNESVMAAENSKTIRKLIYIMKNNSSNSYKMSNDCDTKHNKYIETKEKTIKALLSPLCIIHNNKIRSIGDKEVAEDCQKKETISITPSDIMIQTNVDGNVQTCITKLSEETKLLLNDATTRKGEELELKEPRCDLNHHPPPCSTSTVSVIQRTCDSGKEKCACYASTEKISKVRMRELKSGIVRIFPLSGKENTFQRQDFWGFPAFLPHNLKTSFHFHNSSHSRTQKSGKRNQSATNQVSNHQDQRKQLSGMNQAGSQATLAMLNAIRNRLQQNNAKVMLGRKQKPLGMMLQRTLSNHNQEGE